MLHKFRTFQILSCFLYHCPIPAHRSVLNILSYTTQKRMAFCFFFSFFLHSTSNLTYCLRKGTLGGEVRPSWSGSHEHSMAHEIGVGWGIKTIINYFLKAYLLLLYLRACMYVYHLCAWCPRKPKVIGTPGTGATLWVIETEPKFSTRSLSTVKH